MISNAVEALRVSCESYLDGRTIVLDLDNTLYPESSFLRQAYNSFSLDMAAEFGVNSSQLAEFMYKSLNSGARSTIIQDICSCFGLPPDPTRKQLLFHLREHPPEQPLELFSWAADFLRFVPNFQRCAVITNGNIRQQMNKLAHLPQLRDFPRAQIVFADVLSPKPSPSSARFLENIMPCLDPIYFGDSVSDAEFADAASWSFFRVKFCGSEFVLN